MIDSRESQRTEGASQPRLVVDASPFRRAGEFLADAMTAVLEKRQHVRLAIPGGSALEAATIARDSLASLWQRVCLTWVDERCVPMADAASNRGAAAKLGLVRVDGIRADEVSPMRVLPLYEDGETPDAAVERVRIGWTRDFSERLDVVLLGMGEDGHVASLFPSMAMPIEGWVAHVADSPKPPPDRITLTREALATAERIVLVAVGASKRDAIRQLLSGESGLPAQGLEGLVIVTDIPPAT